MTKGRGNWAKRSANWALGHSLFKKSGKGAEDGANELIVAW
jgi:hypothetical protein